MNKFSNWLLTVLPKIFDDLDIQKQVNARLWEIDPGLRWEAGPWGKSETYFAFSPNFNADLLPITKKLVEEMPAIEGWKFFDAKPRKAWSVRKVLMDGVEYFFDDWRYRLVMFKSGEFFDVDLFSFDEGLPESMKDKLGVFLVASELGEKLFIHAIDRINVNIAPEEGQSSIPIESLNNQILELHQGAPVSE